MLDVVLQGHAEMRERDAIYANPDADEKEFIRAAELEALLARLTTLPACGRPGGLSARPGRR